MEVLKNDYFGFFAMGSPLVRGRHDFRFSPLSGLAQQSGEAVRR